MYPIPNTLTSESVDREVLKFYKKIFRIKCVEKLNLQFIVVIMLRVPSKRRVGRPGLEPRTGGEILLVAGGQKYVPT